MIWNKLVRRSVVLDGNIQYRWRCPIAGGSVHSSAAAGAGGREYRRQVLCRETCSGRRGGRSRIFPPPLRGSNRGPGLLPTSPCSSSPAGAAASGTPPSGHYYYYLHYYPRARHHVFRLMVRPRELPYRPPFKTPDVLVPPRCTWAGGP